MTFAIDSASRRTPQNGAAAVGLGGTAPAGADRVHQHQIGEGKPGVGIVDQLHIGAIAPGHAELRNPWTDQTEIQKCRRRARTAVEDEGQRAAPSARSVLAT